MGGCAARAVTPRLRAIPAATMPALSASRDIIIPANFGSVHAVRVRSWRRRRGRGAGWRTRNNNFNFRTGNQIPMGALSHRGD
jgi:hypothetical protein